jgi:predicted deacetylase
VSIHDVAPSTAAEVAWLRARLDELGVHRRVLKVIPNAHGERPVDQDGALVETLRAEQAAGGEIVVHGWTHRVDGGSAVADHRSSVVDRVRARLFAGEGAEFLDLSPEEADRRSRAGRELLAGLGLAVDGFCAPGWLATPALADVLRSAGFRYLVSYGWLFDLIGQRRHLLPGFGAMGTDDVQEVLVGAEGGYVLLAAPVLPVIRVFLHPQGAMSSRPCARALRAIGRLLADRAPLTFRDLLGPPVEPSGAAAGRPGVTDR